MTPRQIICVASGGYVRIWPECIASHRAYARRHGLEYTLVEQAPASGPHPKWLKFHLALEALEGGRDVMLLDADARITTEAPAFGDVLARHPNADIFAALGVSGRPNSGVVLLRGGGRSRATSFLRTCIANAARPVPREDRVTAEGENGHFIHYLKQSPFDTAFQRLDPGWNRTEPPARPGDSVIHYTGPMRTAYLASLPHIDFHRLEHEEHPLIAHVPELVGEPRARYSRILKSAATPGFLERLARSAEKRAGLAPPPVRQNAPVSLLWRIERATGWLERPTRLLMERLARPGHCAVDIGAHIGYFTTLMADLTGPSGQVIAFEPHPDNFTLLRRSCSSRARVFQRALGDSRGTVTLYFGTGHSNHSLLAQGAGDTGTEVPLTSLDNAAEGLGLPALDVMKCDAEGSECAILRGATHTLAKSPGLAIFIEINPRQLVAAGSGAGQVLEHLDAAGFIMRRINDDYTLGPENKITGRLTANYLAMRAAAWRDFEADL